MAEAEIVQSLFTELLASPLNRFPEAGPIACTADRGVYIIYDTAGEAAHVGRTPSGKNGLRQRLNNHLHGQSSFSKAVFGGDGQKLRDGCYYRFVVVESERYRALLEAFAIGHLCPIHLGLQAYR